MEVAQGAIFMEQNMRFGLILGQLAILKKMRHKVPTYAIFEGVFLCFHTSLHDFYVMTLVPPPLKLISVQMQQMSRNK
jgi:hypothetical protein